MSTDPSPSSAGCADGQAKKKSKKPQYSKFTQQELPAWQPILTPGWVISIFTFIGLLFIPIGLASMLASNEVVEVRIRYDDECLPELYKEHPWIYIQSDNINKTCTKTFSVKRKMKAPVYIYYQLDNYFQNHRRYVKSRSDNQLRTKTSENDVGLCGPEDFTSKDNGSQPIVPCGLIAWSLFNDTYRISNQNLDLVINKKNIAWDSDKKTKFGSDVYPKNFQVSGLIGGAKLNESIPLSEQEDLIVWMRASALPTFRKLYGKIESDIEVDSELTVTMENNYNTYSFEGKKSLILSTTTWIGGRNFALGISYLVIGGLSLLMDVGFLILFMVKPRPLGDPSYLSWNRDPASLRK